MSKQSSSETPRYEITLGADPEFFVTPTGKDNFVPACGLFGGEKGHPCVLNNEGGYLEDGAAVEFNVTPTNNINHLIKKITALRVLFHKKFPGYTTHHYAAAGFDINQLRKNPAAMVIGCSADLHAWGVRAPPEIGLFGATRFAGGHIHVGIDPWPEHIQRGDVIRLLDLLVLMPNIREQNKQRQRFYGGPGIYRDTSYGVEWRSPDPAWSTGNARGLTLAFDRAMLLLKAVLANPTPVELAEIVGGVVNKFECLDVLQAQPFRGDGPNDVSTWTDVSSSLWNRVLVRLEPTKEKAAVLEKDREKHDYSWLKKVGEEIRGRNVVVDNTADEDGA